MSRRRPTSPTPAPTASATSLGSSSSTVQCYSLSLTQVCLVIGTISPDYFITAIQEAYRKRKEQHNLQTEQYIEMSTEMMQLVGSSNRVAKGKHSHHVSHWRRQPWEGGLAAQQERRCKKPRSQIISMQLIVQHASQTYDGQRQVRFSI